MENQEPSYRSGEVSQEFIDRLVDKGDYLLAQDREKEIESLRFRLHELEPVKKEYISDRNSNLAISLGSLCGAAASIALMPASVCIIPGVFCTLIACLGYHEYYDNRRRFGFQIKNIGQLESKLKKLEESA